MWATQQSDRCTLSHTHESDSHVHTVMCQGAHMHTLARRDLQCRWCGHDNKDTLFSCFQWVQAKNKYSTVVETQRWRKHRWVTDKNTTCGMCEPHVIKLHVWITEYITYNTFTQIVRACGACRYISVIQYQLQLSIKQSRNKIISSITQNIFWLMREFLLIKSAISIYSTMCLIYSNNIKYNPTSTDQFFALFRESLLHVQPTNSVVHVVVDVKCTLSPHSCLWCCTRQSLQGK